MRIIVGMESIFFIVCFCVFVLYVRLGDNRVTTVLLSSNTSFEKKVTGKVIKKTAVRSLQDQSSTPP